LQQANLVRGSEAASSAALGSSLEADFLLDFRSVMGVTIPIVEFQSESDVKPDYGFGNTSVELDKAFKEFYGILEYVAELARAEGITFQIARDIGRTQRRVNALNYVLIPFYRATVKRIELVLEEKDREEFVRMKRVKRLIGRRVVI
jgi:V/A-type H+-transporting ATPase subunit D